MITKICNKCDKKKNLTLFNATNGNYRTECKSCQADYHKKYQEKHKEELKEYHKQYSINNSDKHVQRTKKWREDNPEKFKKNSSDYYNNTKKYQLEQSSNNYKMNKERDKKRTKEWKKNNPDKVSASGAKRRALKRHAIPKWVEWDVISALYSECKQLTESSKVPHQVDHIIPLNSEKVCGLHCIANLQILTAADNNRKKCKFQTNWNKNEDYLKSSFLNIF